MCLSRSTYYYEISKEDVVAKRSEAVASMIREIFEHNKGRYGVRRVHHELINRGYKINHKKVQRLMHCMDLKGKRPKEKYHSYQGEVGKVADNLINRDFSTTKPLQKWTTDVSQFSFPWGEMLPLSNSGYAHERGHLLRSLAKSKHGTDPTDAGKRTKQVSLS